MEGTPVNSSDALADVGVLDVSESDVINPVVSIAVGGTEACAVTTSGALYCWGPGPVGDGTSGARSRATPIAIPGGYAAAEVCVGAFHACAWVPMSGPGATEPEAVCWGNNEYGALGVRPLGGPPVLEPGFVSGGAIGGKGVPPRLSVKAARRTLRPLSSPPFECKASRVRTDLVARVPERPIASARSAQLGSAEGPPPSTPTLPTRPRRRPVHSLLRQEWIGKSRQSTT
jgi:hypothetical protein